MKNKEIKNKKVYVGMSGGVDPGSGAKLPEGQQVAYGAGTTGRVPPIANGKRVFVGLSGGVDSSVSAALLKEATPNNFQKLFGRPAPEGFSGYDVTGVFIKVWNPPFLDCAWKEDRLDAMRVCAKLGIPFKTIDLEKEYKHEVVDYMIAEYKSGRTPNPDVMCNRAIKFGAFFRWAIRDGADFVATGHYARIASDAMRAITNHNIQTPNPDTSPSTCSGRDGAGKSQTTYYELLAGADTTKDQSYFLWTLTQRELARMLFPVGGMKKAEVRKLAKKLGLITADKKDSQGLCFLGKIDLKDFLARYLPKKRGKVLNEKGEIIGEHEGAHFFTLGERRGFIVTKKTPRDKPYYVVARDVNKNTITVANRPIVKEIGEVRKEVFLNNVNWIRGSPPTPKRAASLHARARYRAPLVPCLVIPGKTKTSLRVVFKNPIEAPAGQSLVIYDDDTLQGGGVIE